MGIYGQTLRSAITSKGLTLREVAKSTGTQKGYISGICNGKISPPSAKLTEKLCRKLNLSLDKMLAHAVIEKFPNGLPYAAVREALTDREVGGEHIAGGRPKG